MPAFALSTSFRGEPAAVNPLGKAIKRFANGEEDTKGDKLVQDAHALLRDSHLNFVGNAEPKDALVGGVCDVLVCDGFVGNVILKFYEAVAPLMIRMLVKEGVQEPTIRSALRQLDYSEHGGAPLLGVKGVSIICHGRSSARAIKNAIKIAVQAVNSRMDEHIGRRLERTEAGGAA